MSEEMKDRILQLMKSEGMSQKEFSDATGITQASLSSIFNGRTAPTMKHAEAIHRYLPRLSMAWLMFGEGPMYTLTDDEVYAEGDAGMSSSVEGDAPTREGQHATNLPYAKGEIVGNESMRQSSPLITPSTGSAGYAGGAYINNVRTREPRGGTEGAVREGFPPVNMGTPSYDFNPMMVNFPDKVQRKIVEIRIFFDDGTFETFKGN